jgi:hypothetical protein
MTAMKVLTLQGEVCLLVRQQTLMVHTEVGAEILRGRRRLIVRGR